MFQNMFLMCEMREHKPLSHEETHRYCIQSELM